MRVLVTGATTPLGLELVERLLADREVVSIIAVGGEAHSPNLVGAPRLRYRAVDLTRARDVHDLIWGEAREHLVEVVIHMAHHRRAADQGRRVHAQNVGATRELLAACADHPSIRRLVYRSFAEVYAVTDAPLTLLTEEAPLDFDPALPQWVRDRVEADLSVCAYRGGSFDTTVLRCAELFAPASGSQLWDYLQSRICLRPLGFDPMLNLLSLPDAATAIIAAARSSAVGVFNIPGADTLPLSLAIARSRRANVPVPGVVLSPLYAARRALAGFDFRYDVSASRFHYGGILDGSRARDTLQYRPETHVAFPRPWWSRLLQRLAGADDEASDRYGRLMLSR